MRGLLAFKRRSCIILYYAIQFFSPVPFWHDPLRLTAGCGVFHVQAQGELGR